MNKFEEFEKKLAKNQNFNDEFIKAAFSAGHRSLFRFTAAVLLHKAAAVKRNSDR